MVGRSARLWALDKETTLNDSHTERPGCFDAGCVHLEARPRRQAEAPSVARLPIELDVEPRDLNDPDCYDEVMADDYRTGVLP
jgi:hypothetical protein